MCITITFGAVDGIGIELEVADHPEATIRLHKARIKSLTVELAAAQTALQDRYISNTNGQMQHGHRAHFSHLSCCPGSVLGCRAIGPLSKHISVH